MPLRWPSRSGWIVLAAAIFLWPLTAPAGFDARKASSKCRAAIARQGRALLKAELKILDACHARRDAGKFIGDCDSLSAADAKGALAKLRQRFAAAIDAKCSVRDAVRANYPNGDIAGPMFGALEMEVETSAAELQGAPNLIADKAKRTCHKALGKARTNIVNEVVTLAMKCQAASDETAMAFGELLASCFSDPAKSASQGSKAIAKACAAIGGDEVDSCTPLPGCLVDSATATGRRIAGAIYPPRCGNAVFESNEDCEDGNLVDGDGCDHNCTPTACNNGVVTAGEGCDDGNTTDGDGCDHNCTPTGCGNGIVTAGETCDDGNTTDGDGCDQNCTPTGCGNGIITAGEECEDGNDVNGDGCNRCRANDRCETPTVIDATPFVDVLDVNGATKSASDPAQSCAPKMPGPDRSVWYVFTAPRDGVVTVDTFGSDYDTVVTAHTGECGSLTEVACNDDAEEDPGVVVGQSQLVLPVTAGATLRFAVTRGRAIGAGSTLRLSLTFVSKPTVAASFGGFCYFDEGCFRYFCNGGIHGREVVNGRLLFVANDGVSGFELWGSDGTPEGTSIVRDIFPGEQWGSCMSYFPPPPFRPGRSIDAPCASLGAQSDGTSYFFQATDGHGHSGVWRSDGTRNGTAFVGSLARESSASAPRDSSVSAAGAGSDTAKVANGATIYSASTYEQGYDTGRAIYRTRSDGGEAQLLRSSASLGGFPIEPTVVANGTAFFLVCAPCILVNPVCGGQFSDQYADCPICDRKCDGSCDLWKSDGTPGGTARVASTGIVVPFSPYSFTTPLAGAFDMIAVDDTLFLVRTSPYDGLSGPYTGANNLWVVLP